MTYAAGVRRAVTLLVVSWCAACGGDDAGGAPDGGGVSVVATGRVVEAMAGASFEDLPPLADAEVCLHDAPEVPCATTGADGSYRLEGLPADSEVALAMRHDGHQGALVPLVIDERPPDVSVALSPQGEIDARNAAGGVTATDATGSVGLVAIDGSRVAGVSVTVDAPSVEGPVYVDSAGDPDPALGETSDRGFAFAVALPPGSAEASFSHESLSCDVPALGWPAREGGSVRFPVAAGLETTVAVSCVIR